MPSAAVDMRILHDCPQTVGGLTALYTPRMSAPWSDGMGRGHADQVPGEAGLHPGWTTLAAVPHIASLAGAAAPPRPGGSRAPAPRALRSPRGAWVAVPNPRLRARHAPAAPALPMPPATAPAARPTGTVTFLFTDIEGSTACWEQYPAAMETAHRRQEAIIRRAIAAHGGYAYKMVGDAFQAAFQTAPQALDAALAAQRALYADEQAVEQGTAWVPGAGRAPVPLTLALRVRMALHTGVTEERRDDYFGPLLNRLSRLVDVAHGRQVLLTQATRDLLCADLPEGVALRDLGEQRLRDLIRPEHVFQLCARDLPDAFRRLESPGLRVPALLAQWRIHFAHARARARRPRVPGGPQPRLLPAPERVGWQPGVPTGLRNVYNPAYLYTVSMYQ